MSSAMHPVGSSKPADLRFRLINKSGTYKKRTKSASQQLWREATRERPFRPFRRRGRSTGAAEKARHYWASRGSREDRETVLLRTNGGGSEPPIQLSPVQDRAGGCASLSHR